jgi:hypothetical protein
VTERLFKTIVTKSHGVKQQQQQQQQQGIYGAKNIFRIKLFTASESVKKMAKFLVCGLELPGNKTRSTINLRMNEKSSQGGLNQRKFA